ncbi:SDR family NAD(P)-dependent oxidoreductase [Actinomadura sp. BRA 177]|uniref:SDR family NAD(P)-dependent oxidoreductase n=1 Tax=Actinomadura sp. BRA 177 TaxID=2745202 RepID=UPI0015958859|nr:SDR family NAD(P)-dependent oxidoreductase [Actinomadura sp. BRA 177]NVI89061.1 SDR family NAD(P)-dependent oxidoreductase [Actinomadura sp. BRA 177]
MRIEGTSAVVSGGASGLGLATARRLLGQGGRVVLLDLPSSAGEKTAAELGDGAVFVAGDVRSEEDVAAAVEAASALAPLRIAVSCAGTGRAGRTVGRDGPMPLDGFSWTVEVNLVGTFNLIRLAAARIAEQEPVGGERGVAVATASVAAYEGQIGQAAYSASKGGVVGMTLPIARDLASLQIRMMTIAPGIFETPMLGGLSDEVRESLGRQVPHPSRLGAPDEYAAMVQHIVENPMLNGETIRLDGAIRMSPR